MTKIETTNDTKRNLPAAWRWVKLEEVIREAQAGFACGLRDPQGIAQLRMNNLDTRGNFVWDDVLRVPHEANDIEQFLIVPGDVLFNNTNSTELVGKSALFESFVEPIVYSNHFTRLRTVTEALLPDFLASWLNHKWQQGVFAAICNRWIGQSAVKADKLLNLNFPLPPLSEQRRIAGVLREQMAAVEKARAAAQARLEVVKTLPASLLRQVFPQPGQPLPVGWRWVRLGEVCIFKRGPFGGSLKKEVFTEDGYKVYEQQHAIQNDFEIGSYYISESKFNEMLAFAISPGDLIISCSGTMGRVAVVPMGIKPGIINQALLKLTPAIIQIEPNYLKFYLQSDPVQIRYFRMTAGAAIQNVASVSQLKEIPVPLPPLDEQRRIARVLCEQIAAVEKARAAAEEELQTINALPAALLRRAFNGEI